MIRLPAALSMPVSTGTEHRNRRCVRRFRCMATDAAARREQLKQVFLAAKDCARCPQLVETRSNVVFGAGNADADLMLIGEAPGRSEDQQALPVVGQAGQLLDDLLSEIGLARSDVFVTNVLMCRPPGNRDPHPNEVERCQRWLWEKVELVRPTLVCSLGNFATKLLRGDQTGITRIHGRQEERILGALNVRLLPLFHPAAALYTPGNVELLRADFQRIPELLALPPLPQPEREPPATGSEAAVPSGQAAVSQTSLF